MTEYNQKRTTETGLHMARPTRMTIPRYTQIAGYLRAKLEAGDWGVGERLPPIDKLAEQFSVAPLTMRESLIVLEEEGLIIRKRGVGTFVCGTPREQRWLSIPTDWASFVSALDQLEVNRTILEHSDETPPLLPEDGVPCPSYTFMKRIHARHGRPFCVLNVYLSSEVFMRAPKRFRENVILPEMNSLPGLKITKARQSLRVDVADVELAELLDIPLAGPIVKVRRVVTDDEGAVIYFADVAYRSDVVSLEMDLSPR